MPQREDAAALGVLGANVTMMVVGAGTTILVLRHRSQKRGGQHGDRDDEAHAINGRPARGGARARDGADSVGLKLTVSESSQRSTVAALEMESARCTDQAGLFLRYAGARAQQAGVVVRARRVQGKGSDSVVKLRPVVPADLPEELRKSLNLGVEVDALPGGFVCSASFKAKVPPTAVRDTILGERPLGSSFPRNSGTSSPYDR